MNGYQLMQELTGRSGRAWRPSPGSVYPALRKLENERLIRSVEVGSRRVFELTEVGKTEAEGRKDEPRPWDMGEENDPLAVIRDQVHGIAGAAMHLAQVGTPEELAQGKKILYDATRNLYRLLAGEE
jgi:DNA-binding PadR family transcriptional regulator